MLMASKLGNSEFCWLGFCRLSGDSRDRVAWVHEAADLASEVGSAEVHEEAHRGVGEAKVGDDLCDVNVEESVDRLDLEHDAARDDNVESVRLRDGQPIVEQGNKNLPLARNPALDELIVNARLLRALEQPGPEAPMDLHAGPKNFLRQVIDRASAMRLTPGPSAVVRHQLPDKTKFRASELPCEMWGREGGDGVAGRAAGLKLGWQYERALQMGDDQTREGGD